MQHLLSFISGIVTFSILDGLWLGFVMRDVYVRQLMAVNGGPTSLNWTAALLTYPVMILAVQILALPRATSLGSAFLFGAAVGLAMYGVYDLTNMATLKAWSWTVVLIDLLWGMVLCGLVAVAMYASARYVTL